MLREVFWGIDVNHQKLLVAIESNLQQPEIQQVYVFRSEHFENTDAFYQLKNQLYDRWRNGESMDLPSTAQRITWDFSKSAAYPKEVPSPEIEDKKEAIVRKILKYILQQYSKSYQEEIRVGLLGFKQKIANATVWKAEDRAFLDNFDKLIRAGQDIYANNETKLEIENECLTGGDAKELRDILREIRERLETLRTELWESNSNAAYEQVRELKEKCAATKEWREAREDAFQVKNEILEKELSRPQKDELMTEIKNIIQELSDRQAQEKAGFEKEAAENHERLAAALAVLEPQTLTTEEFQPVREALKKLQFELREVKLTKIQRNELFDRLDVAFKTLGERQNKDREHFLESSEHNFTTLSERLDIGKRLAQFNEDFQETRDFLKSIQADISGSALLREQRENLRTGLNEAFEVLNKRADKYYQDKKFGYEKRMKEMDTMREKKREEWIFRIKEKIMRVEQNIKNSERSLESDRNYLQSQQEKWEDSQDARIKTNIDRIAKQIEEKENRIADMRREIAEMEEKLAKG